MHISNLRMISPLYSTSLLSGLESLERNLLQLYIRLEVAFWGFIIPRLRRSLAMQQLICFAYPIVVHQQWVLRLPKPILLIGTGLSMGLLIGFLGAILVL